MAPWILYYSKDDKQRIFRAKDKAKDKNVLSKQSKQYTKVGHICPLTGKSFKQRGKFWDYIKSNKLDVDNMTYDRSLNVGTDDADVDASKDKDDNKDNITKLLDITYIEYLWSNYFELKGDKKLLENLIGQINLELYIILLKVYNGDMDIDKVISGFIEEDVGVNEEVVHEDSDVNVQEEIVQEENVQEENGVYDVINEDSIKAMKTPCDKIENTEMDISSDYDKIKDYYNNNLNKDKNTFKTKNDEPTPIECVEYMISKIPSELWSKENLKILDPCSGNGNFFIPILYKLRENYTDEEIFNKLYFNDTNELRINNIKKIFNEHANNLNITQDDFLNFKDKEEYDLVVANPPYAKLLENGKRASKNHNMIKDFIIKTLKILKKDGYLLYITPDNWMSKADRNTLIKDLTKYQIIHLNIHKSKDYFPKIGSSFTWYIIQKKPFYKDIEVEGRWRGKEYTSYVSSRIRSFIPQFYNKTIESICLKTIENETNPKFKVETTSDLHKYTKRDLISIHNDEDHPYKLIHTPKQTVYSSRPHKWQEGFKVFISTTDKYGSFIDECGMTQSIAFIRCDSKEQAEEYKKILDHNLYKFINDICRWGNFNNNRILQSFPIPTDSENIWNNFDLTKEEINFIVDNV